jgi:HD-like signal output (HDOD) protein
MAKLLDRFAQEMARSASLPARPEVLNRLVCTLGGDDDVTLPELADVIHLDPALSGGVLKIANAAAYGGHRKILSIPEALLRIGLTQTGRLALALSLYNMIPRTGSAANPREFWLHSLGTASAAAAVVRRMPELSGYLDPEGAFLLGLFHDVGLLALAGHYDREYTETRRAARESERPYWTVEAEVLGTDHGVLGALIAHSWGLPALAVEAIRAHHAAGDVEPEVACRVSVLRLAEAISLQAGLGDLDEGGVLDIPMLGGDEIGPDVIAELIDETRAETEGSDALLALAR